MRIALVAALLFVPLVSSGQIIPTLESPVEVRVTPSNPGPGDQVVFEVVNAPREGEVIYRWSVDGSLYDQGRGVDTITLQVGDVGEAFSVSLSVYVNGVLYAEKERVVRPAEISLVWEGDVYTPPFYSGFPFPNRESSVNLLAVPNIVQNGVLLSSDELYYEWFINNSRRNFAKGFGLDSTNIKVPGLGEPFSVKVVAKTIDGLIEAQETVYIAPADPEILVYEKTPLMGVLFNRAIANSFELTEEETTFVAFPLYSSPLNALDLSWKINGEPSEVGATPQELVLRREGQGGGRYNIAIQAKNTSRLFERFSKNFLLTF